MTVSATLGGVFLKGTAGARPAANAVAGGTVYSATDTGVISQSDGSSWSVWATISSGLADPMTTRGDLIYRNASNVTTRLGRGSAGQVLSSDGADIAWAAPAASGALILLEQHTASGSAQLDFTSFISSTYDTYRIIGEGIQPATNAVDLRLEAGSGGGPTWDTGNSYEWCGNGWGTDGVAHANVAATGIAKIFNSMSNAAAYGNGGFDLLLRDPQSTSIRKQIHGTQQFVTSAPRNVIAPYLWTWTTSGTAMSGLRFIMSSGNIATGTIRIYGIAK